MERKYVLISALLLVQTAASMGCKREDTPFESINSANQGGGVTGPGPSDNGDNDDNNPDIVISPDPLIQNPYMLVPTDEPLPEKQVIRRVEGKNSKDHPIVVEFSESIAFDPSNSILDCQNPSTLPYAARMTVDSGVARLRYCTDDKTEVRIKFQDSNGMQVGMAVVSDKTEAKRYPIILLKGALGFQCLTPGTNQDVSIKNFGPVSSIAECRTGAPVSYTDGDDFFSIMDPAHPGQKLIDVPFTRTRKLRDYPLFKPLERSLAISNLSNSLEAYAKIIHSENLFTQEERAGFVKYVEEFPLLAEMKRKISSLTGCECLLTSAEALNRKLNPNGSATEVATTQETWAEAAAGVLEIGRRLPTPKMAQTFRFVIPALKKELTPANTTQAAKDKVAAAIKSYRRISKFHDVMETLKREVEGNSATTPVVCVDDHTSDTCRDMRFILKAYLP